MTPLFNKSDMTAELISHGVAAHEAAIVADALYTADLYGVTSHGSLLLPAHIERIRRGAYNLSPTFRTLRETAAFAVIDGDNALGPVAADHCMRVAVEGAKRSGIFTVFSRNNNTFGAAFYYSMKAAEAGCIGYISSNSPAQMAPIGGKEKLLGTNPFSVAIPVPGDHPIVIDMATSAVAKSKFKEYKARGEALPLGWALDESGRPTTDPDEALRGLVLPMAGYKGYALSAVIDILSGLLSGAAYLDGVGRFYSEDSASMNVGFFCVAIDPVAVLGDSYTEEIRLWRDRIRHSLPIDGKTVSLPGDDRLLTKKENEKA